jgi:hypothetical protein
MMGKKERKFAPLIKRSLEELVPQDHFYRHVERTLDLSYVREAGARDLCWLRATLHRSSGFLAPLQLVMFFEGIVRCANRIL